MPYPPEAIERFNQDRPRIERELTRAYIGATAFGQQRLTNADAKKFMLQGVARRLGLISRCSSRIFEAFPPSQSAPLGRNTLEDVNIYLHAFVIHVNALQDNIAWAYVKEFDIKLGKFDVSLFKNRLQAILPQAIRNYLAREDVQRWHASYSTEFRDALAHRIPLYIPPSQLTDDDARRAEELQNAFNESLRVGDWKSAIDAQDAINSLGMACPYFLHDFDGDKIILHPQILSDALTAAELYRIVSENWAPPE